MHLLAVALDRCEQFGASLGVPLHAEQHRRRARSAGAHCRDRVRWHGAARPRHRESRSERASASPKSYAGSFASGASAVAASSASIASARRPSRSSRTPFAASSTGLSGSSSPATSSQASSTSSVPAARADVDPVERVFQRLGRQALRLGKRRIPRGACRRSHQREPKRVPGIGPAGRDAAATQQQIACGRAFAAHDQQTGQPEQCRLAPRVDVQHATICQLGVLRPVCCTKGFGKPQRRLVPFRQMPLQRLHPLAKRAPRHRSAVRPAQDSAMWWARCRRARPRSAGRSAPPGQDDWRAGPCRGCTKRRIACPSATAHASRQARRPDRRRAAFERCVGVMPRALQHRKIPATGASASWRNVWRSSPRITRPAWLLPRSHSRMLCA